MRKTLIIRNFLVSKLLLPLVCFSICPLLSLAQKTVVSVNGIELAISESGSVFVNGGIVVDTSRVTGNLKNGDILNSGKLFVTDSINSKCAKLFYKTSNPFLDSKSGDSKGDVIFCGKTVFQTVNSSMPNDILFNNMNILNPQGIKLKNSVIALSGVNPISGSMFLGGKNLALYYDAPVEYKYDGFIVNETNDFRIWDSTQVKYLANNVKSGFVLGKFSNLMQFHDSKIGIISDATEMEDNYLKIQRGHLTLPYAGDGSIWKYFLINGTKKSDAIYTISYLDSIDYANLEIKEPDFRLFLNKRNSVVTYKMVDDSKVDTASNKAEGALVIGADTTLVTIADYNCDDPPRTQKLQNMNVCAGSNFEVKIDTVKNLASQSIYYLWSKDNIPNYSNKLNFIDNIISSNTVKYKVKIYDNRGCFSYDSIMVYCHPVPVAKIKLTNGGQSCLGTTTVLKDSSKISDSSSLTRRWFLGDGATSNNSVINHIYSNPTTYNIFLVSSSNYCSDTVSGSIVINSLPNSHFTAENLCGDSSLYVRFFNTSSLPNPSDVISETKLGFGVNDTVSFDGYKPLTHLFSSTGTKTIDLVVTSDKGCSSTYSSSVTVDKQTVNFSVESVCQGGKTIFKNQSSSTSSTTPVYTWIFGDGTTSNEVNPVKIYASANTYRVVLYMQTGICVDSMVKEINVFPIPDASFTANNACQGSSVNFTPKNSGYSEYKWNIKGEYIYEESPTRTFYNDGNVNVTLTVKSDSGCISTSTGTIKIYSKPLANFTVKSACFGSPTLFYNQSSVSGASLAYHWQFTDFDSSTVANPQFTFTTESSAKNVRLIVISNFNCSDTITKSAEVYPIPDIPLEGNITWCENSYPIDVTVTNISGCSYVWDDGNKQAKRTLNQSKTYTVTATSDKNCSSTESVQVLLGTSIDPVLPNNIAFCGSGKISTSYNSNMCTWWTPSNVVISNQREIIADQTGWFKLKVAEGNCSARDSVFVTIKPIPNISLGSDIHICAGTSTILDAGAGFTTYSWSTDESTREIVVSRSGKYRVSVTNANGCSNADTISVFINSVPEQPFTTDEITACRFADLNGGSNTLSYQWSTGAVTNTIQVAESGSYWVKVSNTECSTYDTLKVTINQVDIVDLGQDISLCEGRPVVLNAGNHGANYSYFWNKQISASNQFSVNKAGNYICEIKNNDNGCTSSDIIFVSFNPSPRVDLGMDRSLCGATSLILDAGNSGSTIQWGSLKGFVSIQQTVTITDADKYWVMVMNENGCLASDTIVIYPSSANIFSQFIAASRVFVGDTVVFKNMSYPSPYTSFWRFGDGATSTEENPSHIFHYVKKFNVILTVNNSYCFSTITKPITVIPDTKGKRPDGTLIDGGYIEILSSNLFPNPTSGAITFIIDLSDYADVVVGIYSLTGTLVKMEKFKHTLEVNQQYYLNQFTPGVYILKAWVGNKSVAYKIVKTY